MKKVSTIAFAVALGVSTAVAAQDIPAGHDDAQNAPSSGLDPLDPAGVDPQPQQPLPPETMPPENMPQTPVGPPDNSLPPMPAPPPMGHEAAPDQLGHPEDGTIPEVAPAQGASETADDETDEAKTEPEAEPI